MTEQQFRLTPHPVVRRRRRLGLSATALAESVSAHRETISALEQGRTRTPSPELTAALEAFFKMPKDTLIREIEAWKTSNSPRFTVRQTSILQLDPKVVGKYASFAAWRRDFGVTRTALAALVSTPHRSVFAYEDGQRQVFPERLQMALMRTLKLTDEYMAALSSLPPSDSRTYDREHPKAPRTPSQAARQVREMFDDEETI